MLSSPSKRRKLSPTSSAPGGDIPNTPSRIPVAIDTGRTTPKRPSFASPTKASISRHNPQLLERSRSPAKDGRLLSVQDAPVVPDVPNLGADTQRAASSGTNNRERDINVAQSATQINRAEVSVEAYPAAIDMVADPFSPRKGLRRSPVGIAASAIGIQPVTIPSEGGGLTGAPRRRSRSPEKTPAKTPAPFVDMGGVRDVASQRQAEMSQAAQINAPDPFKPRGLRRSPVGVQLPPPEPAFVQAQPEPNPFKRGGLRRSGGMPQASLPIPPATVQKQTTPEVSLPPKPSTPRQEQIEPDAPRTRHTNTRSSALAQEQAEPALPLSSKPSARRQQEDEPAPSQTPEPPTHKQEKEDPAPPISFQLSARKQVDNMLDSSQAPRSPTHRQEKADAAPILSFKPSARKQRQSVIGISEAPEPPEHRKEQEEPVPPPAFKPLARKQAENVLSPFQAPKSPAHRQDQVEPAPPPSVKPTLRKQGKNVLDSFQLPRLPPVRQEQEEPDLPPTPVQLGLPDPIVTTPPSGIHDTPSKRFKKRRSGGKSKSSPLKPLFPPKPQEGSEPAAASIPEAVPFPKIAPINKEKLAPYPRRIIEPIDRHAQKKAMRERLAKEVKILEADLRLVQKENERLRQLQELKGESSIPEKSDDLLDLLLRQAVPQETVKPPAPSIFRSIISFLPFAARKATVEQVPQVKEAPIITHEPLPLDNLLPYLQVFTPLAFNSAITLIPQSPAENGSRSSKTPLQQHIISAASPRGLFTAQISLTVDPSNFSITTLRLLDLDHSAEAEFGKWARDRISLGESRDVLAKDATTIFWAMARWFEIALERAKFWLAVERDMGSVEGRRKVMEELKRRGIRKRKRARDVVVSEEGDEDNAAEDAAPLETPTVKKWTRKQLLPMMKRTNMIVLDGIEGVELVVSWKISFDWTGEAESSVSASVRLPAAWQAEDERRGLAKIPQTFKDIVKTKGPMEATRVVVSLLMGV